MNVGGGPLRLTTVLGAVPAACLLFTLVWVFPAISSGVAGRRMLIAFWDLAFGVLWWFSDHFFDEVHGLAAFAGFVLWPMAVSMVAMVLLIHVCAHGTSRVRIVIVAAFLLSLVIVIPMDFETGSLFQTLPFWSGYLFLTY